MASSYSTDLKLELMVTGENSGTWGDKTNTNLNLLQQAIAGYQSIALTSTNTTLAMTDATISDARNAVIEFTGTLAANSTVYVASGIEKTYTIKNSTTGAFTLALNQVGGSSVIWGATEKNIKGVYLNGTNANTIDLSTLGGQISTSTALADFVIGPNELDTASVTEVKIASSAVTSTKIASFAVTSGALDTASVTSFKIAAGAVGPTQLENTSVTAGSFTAASITVDAQGRITAASSGSGGAGGFVANLASIGPASGTFTKNPATNRIVVYARAGGGGGGGTRVSLEGGDIPGAPGGQGGFSYFNIPTTGPYAVPYATGAPGTGGPANSANPGGAGGSTNFSGPAAFTTTGGNGGNGNNPNSNANQGNPGAAAPGVNLAVPLTIAPAYSGGAGAVGGGATAGGVGLIIVNENIGT